jgi:hypothetical protein
MKTYEGMDAEVCVFIYSALVGGEWLNSHLDSFTPAERGAAVPIRQNAEWALENVRPIQRNGNS